MWQIPQKLLNNHFTNVIIQKVIKTKFVSNYRAYVRMKNKMIKMQYHSLWALTKEWSVDSPWKIKHGSLKKTTLNFLVIVMSKNKESSFAFIFLHRD